MSIEKTLDKIDMVYDGVRSLGLTFGNHQTKERLSDGTINTYRGIMHTFAKWVHSTHGISDIAKVKPRHAYEFVEKQIQSIKNGGSSFFDLYKFPHAIESFRQACTKTGVYKHTVKIGDKREILATFKAHGLKRESGKSTSMKATAEDCNRVIKAIEDSKSPMAKTIANVCRFQQYTGGRISATLRVTAGDVQFQRIDGKNVAVVTFRNDKGGLTREVSIRDPKHVAFLKELVGSRKPGAPLFQVKNKDGKDKKVKLSAQQVKNMVGRVSARLGINRNGKTFTTHSFRKQFAQKQYDERMKKTKNQLKKEVSKVTKNNPSLGKKFTKMVDEINRKRNTPREATREELARWLTSVELGHGRLGVMSYYLNRKSTKKAS